MNPDGIIWDLQAQECWGLATHCVLFFKGSGRSKTQNMFLHSNYPPQSQVHVDLEELAILDLFLI